MCRLRYDPGLRGCRQRKIFIVYVYGDEVGGMRFYRTHVAAVRGGDENCSARVSPLTNEEPLVIVKACIDIVWEIV